MTTATEPPLVDEPSIGVDELPALDQPDERACELRNFLGLCCGSLASWVASGHCTGSCEHRQQTRLVCDGCKLRHIDAGIVCITCRSDVAITRIEAIR